MNIVKHPFWGNSLLTDFFEEDRYINSPVAVNVKESDKAYDVELAAPGFGKKDFKISIDHGLVTVSAEKEMKNEKKEDKYRRREFGYSSFLRTFSLPSNTNEQDVDARYEDGVLRLSIAKKAGVNGSSEKIIEIK